MFNYLILEDEPSARRRLQRMIKELRPDWQLAGHADSVQTGIKLLASTECDLILSDIELSDGSCFKIFSKSKLNIPVIFITAYNQYAVKAFEFNSIHYLLKPVKLEKLEFAISKFEAQPQSLVQIDQFSDKEHKVSKTLISHVGNRSILIDTRHICYIYHQNRSTKVYLENGRSHLLDHSLDALMNYLSHDHYFRINRQSIVSKRAIKQYEKATSNRLLLTLEPASHLELVVSKENSASFKQWLL